MTKLNGFEKYLIVTGVEKVALEMKADIRDLEERGKNPLMTIGYVEMVMKDLLSKVDSFSIKEKKSRQMSEQRIKGTWKGINTSPSISKDPIIGMVYEGKKNRGKGQSKTIVGILIEYYNNEGDAILRDSNNFPHSVALDSLKILLNK